MFGALQSAFGEPALLPKGGDALTTGIGGLFVYHKEKNVNGKGNSKHSI
jgi:hypothetical protein